MCTVQGPKQALSIDEYRDDSRHIRKMTTTVIGIVQQEDVSLSDVIAEVSDHFLGRPRHCADMYGYVLRLGYQVTNRVADGHRKIPARIENLRIGCPQHRLAHFLDDACQAMLYDRRGHGIDIYGHELPPKRHLIA